MLNPVALRGSLVLTWLTTAFASVWEWHGLSMGLLREGGVSTESWRTGILAAGIAVDAIVGWALWLRPGRRTYRVAMFQVLLMSAVATWLLPSLWLHPLGPLIKNLPILAVLRHLELHAEDA